MSAKTWRLIHKWTAIGVGVFILTWTISGIVMVLPGAWFGSTTLRNPAGASYADASISPAQVFRQIEAKTGTPIKVREIQFKKILDGLYYQVSLADGSVYLINTQTAEQFNITPEIAVQLTRAAVQTEAELASIEELNEHDLMYPFGALPAYRIRFAGEGGNIYYVLMQTGDVSKSTLATRLRAMISSLHTFDPIVILFNKSRTRTALLVFTSMIAIVTAFTGYYLAILPLLRRKAKGTRANGVQPALTRVTKNDSAGKS